jgi:hypothetical protein
MTKPTLSVGMAVHQESMAVASVAKASGAEVVALGRIGTRQCDIDRRIRMLHAKRQPLGLVYEAGPCGSWLSRDLTQNG